MQRRWSAAATAAASGGCALSEHCNASKKRLRFARFPLFSLCSSLSSPLSFPLSLPLPLHTLSLLAAYNLTGEIQFPKCWNCRRRPVANANAVDGAQGRLAPPSVVHLFPRPPSSPIPSSPSQLICCCRVVSLFLSLCMRCCRLLQLVSAFVATLS